MSGSRTELEVLDLLCWNSSWKIFSVCVKPFFLRNAVTYPTILSSSILSLISESKTPFFFHCLARGYKKFDSSWGLFLESDLLYGLGLLLTLLLEFESSTSQFLNIPKLPFSYYTFPLLGFEFCTS